MVPLDRAMTFLKAVNSSRVSICSGLAAILNASFSLQ